MLLFGHLGPSVAAARKIFGVSKVKFVVFAALLGILPDLIDKPLALLFFSNVGTSRLFGHTYLFCILYFLILLAYFKNLKLAALFALFPFGHLMLDIIDDPTNCINMFWPLVDFKATFTEPYTLSALITSIREKFSIRLHSVVVEIIGFIYILKLLYSGKSGRHSSTGTK